MKRLAAPLGGYIEVSGSFPHPEDGSNFVPEVYDYEPTTVKVDSVLRRYKRQGLPSRSKSAILKVVKSYLKDVGRQDLKVSFGRPNSVYVDAALIKDILSSNKTKTGILKDLHTLGISDRKIGKLMGYSGTTITRHLKGLTTNW